MADAGLRIEAETRVEVVRLSLGDPPRRLFIVDGLVEPEAARSIFARVRDLAYTLDDADREDTQDYNHLKHDFAIGGDDGDVGDPVMLMLAGRARELLASQGIACGPLYRIYANMNLFGDFQFAHEDGEGWTALLFANPEWGEDWGGEFLAYDGDDAPYAYAVSPKPGRMLLFDGRIRHRGGVPSKLCQHPRITLAIKFRR